MAKHDEVTSAVKDIAESVSMQTKAANKIWLLLMAVVLIVLFPPKAADTEVVSLPFELGQVNGSDFYPTIFFLISVLVLAFATAYAQALRAHDLAHEALDKMSDKAVFEIHVRDFFDISTDHSVNRVAPLAQLIGGPTQFHRHHEDSPKWSRWLTAFSYLVLKLVSAAIFWGLPWFSFARAYGKALTIGTNDWILAITFFVAASALAVVTIYDIWGMVKIFRFLSPRGAAN